MNVCFIIVIGYVGSKSYLYLSGKVYYKSRKEEHWLENLSEVSEKVKKEFNICESMFCVKDLPLDRCLRIHP